MPVSYYIIGITLNIIVTIINYIDEDGIIRKVKVTCIGWTAKNWSV